MTGWDGDNVTRLFLRFFWCMNAGYAPAFICIFRFTPGRRRIPHAPDRTSYRRLPGLSRLRRLIMGIRSKVAKLPATVRAELDRRIVEGAFSGYQALAEWLQAQGYKIADDSVQRYGARLRRQLDAINLAREQVKALAIAGKGAGDSADSLTAIAVQLIQQQVLSILFQTAQPEAADQTETADGEAKTLDLGHLQRLTRIIVDLNRVTSSSHQRAGKAAHTGHAAADEATDEPKQKGLSEKAYHMIRNALLTRYPVEAYSADQWPDEPDPTPADPAATSTELPETPPESAETPADPDASSAQPAGVPAEPIQAVAHNAAPAETQQSSSEATQPPPTAPDRSSPDNNKIYRIPLTTSWKAY
jgi:Protein of unknown function (DUF3486)